MPDPLGLSLLAGLLGRGRSPSIGHGLAPLVTLGGGIPSLVYSLSLLMGICCRQPHSLEAEASCFSLCPLSGHPVSPVCGTHLKILASTESCGEVSAVCGLGT